MYRFHPQLLLRAPFYPLSVYREADLQEQLREPHFRAAIFLASPVLYQELKKKGFDVCLLTPGAIHVLTKYRNRMCFRPTPFGLFSGFTTTAWSEVPAQPLVVHRKSYRLKASLSFSEALKAAAPLLEEELATCQTYRTNGSLYKAEKAFRFIRSKQLSGDIKRHFSIDSVPCQAFLRGVLAFCEVAKRRSEVLAFIQEQTEAPAPVCEDFFEQLVAQQLLLSTLAPNITGPDHLSRLLQECRREGLETARTKHLAALLQELEDMSQKELAEGSLALLRRGEKLPGACGGKPGLYVNLDAGPVTGGIDAVYQQRIMEGLHGLWQLLPSRRPQGLQDFVAAYKRKFENRTVPLLKALDPETGVGYQGLAEGHAIPKLLEGIAWKNRGEEEVTTTLGWTPAHALLMRKWCGIGRATAPIVLTEEELLGLPKMKVTDSRPPSLSVLFRVLDDQVVLEQAGGVSAAALLGRFTPLHEEVEAMAKDLVEKEDAANPAVVFAEIAHIGDTHAANIERRKAVRKYEIPVLVHSTRERTQQVLLSDLWVSVQGDQVVLYSKTLQKVVVPRLSSAYNFSREELAVFRFLCDLQYQGIEADFTLDLQKFFPGMRHYPRVVYRSAILNLASWHLGKEELLPLQAAAAAQDLGHLRAVIARQGWPRHIALTEHDHQLVFDLEQDADLELFAQTIKNRGTILVREFPFAAEGKPMVTDEVGSPFVHQFLASLYQEQEVYKASSVSERSRQAETKVRRKLLPGREWLYLKVYCHPARSNHLLAKVLLPVINGLLRRGEVRQWFFVRYRDPDYHLRIRLAVPATGSGSVLPAIRQKLASYVQNGTVADVQVATYERELERYGPARMEAVEEVFCASSALVAAYISKATPEEVGDAPYRAAFSGADMIAAAFRLGLEDRTTLFYQLFEGYFQEFNGDAGLEGQLSRKYREISQVPGVLPGPPGPQGRGDALWKKRQAAFQTSLEALAQKARSSRSAKVSQLVTDLVHMHVNRLFVDQPREQELVLYYCLWKHYRSQLARSRR